MQLLNSSLLWLQFKTLDFASICQEKSPALFKLVLSVFMVLSVCSSIFQPELLNWLLAANTRSTTIVTPGTTASAPLSCHSWGCSAEQVPPARCKVCLCSFLASNHYVMPLCSAFCLVVIIKFNREASFQEDILNI